MNKLSKFISWNEALLDYFVRNGSTVWYVTDSVIEHIGKKYEIQKGCEESFLNNFTKSLLFVKANNSINAHSFFAEPLFDNATTVQYKCKTLISSEEDIYSRESVSTLIEYSLFLAQNDFFYFTFTDDTKKLFKF